MSRNPRIDNRRSLHIISKQEKKGRYFTIFLEYQMYTRHYDNLH